MQTALETAPRTLKNLLPEPGMQISRQQQHNIEAWFRTIFCSAVRSLISRADFRELARASIDQLCQENQTALGRLIARIDAALIRTAKGFSRCLRRPAIRSALLEMEEERIQSHPLAGLRTKETIEFL